MIPATHIIEVTYIIAVVLFILSLKWLSSPATARRGVWAGEAGMLLAIVGTLLYHGIVDYKWIAIALVLGAIIGVPARQCADDGGAAANCAEPCLRRALRDPGGYCRILPAHAQCAAVRDVGAVAGSDSRRSDLHRQLDGGGKVAGGAAATADHVQGTELRQPGNAGCRHRAGGNAGAQSCATRTCIPSWSAFR